jgi:TolB protein
MPRLARPVARLLVAGALVAALTPPALAVDRKYIEISGANVRPLPLALGALTGSREPAAVIGATLQDDLALSGLFDLLDPRSFLADQSAEGLAASSIDFPKWAAVGADSLAKGAIAVDDKTGAVKAEFRLFDVVTRKEALRASLSGKDPRRLAHEWADKLYEHFTGERGIFRTRLAFIRRTAAGKELWVADFDGRGPLALSTGGELNLLPAWSPDGRSVVFTSYRGGSPMLHVADLASRRLRALPARGDLQAGAAYSPDGKRIAYTQSQNGNSDIWAMNADGSSPVQLTDTRESESSPSWSPDGRRLAFVSTRSGDPQIFVMNADGSGVERLTFQGTYNQTPDWSPRGDLIAFTARDERNVFDLFTVNPSTRKIQRLTQDQGNNEEPSFSPNGRHLVFVSTREGKRRLWTTSLDGTHQRPVPLDMDAGTPSWGPWLD